MQTDMITRKLGCVLWVVATLFYTVPALAEDHHGDGKSTPSHGGMMKERYMSGHGKMGSHHRSISPLAMKEELGLSDEQVKTLEPLESDYRKTSIKNRAEFKIAMIDLSELLDQPAPDKQAISRKVDEIGAIQKSMMVYRVNTMLKLKEALTSAQYDKFRGSIKAHMEHKMNAPKHGMGGMMHHDAKGKHPYGQKRKDD